MKINLIVALLAVLLSGYMRFLQPKPTTEKPAAAQQA